MKTTVKGKPTSRYRAMKDKLGKKLDSIEQRVAAMDGRVRASVQKRGAQLAVTLDRAAAKVRKTLSKSGA